MKGTEFVATFKGKGYVAWEAAAFELAKQGSTIAWPMVDVPLAADGHTAVLRVASDVFAIGEKDDYLRLPLSPGVAQSIANLSGFLLPTPKIVYEVWKAAEQKGVQLTPAPQTNRGADLEDYAKHNRVIEAQLKTSGKAAAAGALVTGHKKDVVISNIYKPGRVVIYGWFWPTGMKVPAFYTQPIQPRINNHFDSHIDYSHGIRFVAPNMTVDGQERRTEDVLRDPVLSKLISDEGPLRTVRYPARNDPATVKPRGAALAFKVVEDVYLRPSSTTSLADQGLAALVAAQVRR